MSGLFGRTDLSAPQTAITDVPRDTPPPKAGLRKGDIVIDFDGLRVESARQFKRIVAETPPGRTVKMTVLRDGARRSPMHSVALWRCAITMVIGA